MAESLESIADRLYAVPPARFVSARDEAVTAAKSAGDRASAKTIAALKRPTVAAWMINLLALRQPDQLDELFQLGAQMRTAQSNLHGSQLRELTSQRRAAVNKLVNQSVSLAVKAGAARASLPTTEVEMMLSAALADDEIASDVRSGRLIRTAQYDGFGAMPRPDLQLVPGGREDRPKSKAAPPVKAKTKLASVPEPAGPKVSSAALARRKAAARRLHQAEVALSNARRAYEVAEAALREAERAEDLARKTLEAAENSLVE